MTDKEKLTAIKAEIERLYNQSLSDEIRQADRGLERAASVSYGKSKACKELLSFYDSLKEESVSIWHDANERPKKSGTKTAWITNDGVFYSGWYNKNAFGHEDMRDSIVKGFEFDKIRKWCYLEDLLNTD